MARGIIKFLKVREVKTPSRANKQDAGIDFYVPTLTDTYLNDFNKKNPTITIQNDVINDNANICIIVKPHERILMPSGFHCKMGQNRCLIAFNKSGVASKFGLTAGACVVDETYQGEIHLSLINTSNEAVNIIGGMKILQFIEMPIFTSDIIIKETSLKKFYEKQSERGSGGFGSSDNK